jgi:hypothetical protein
MGDSNAAKRVGMAKSVKISHVFIVDVVEVDAGRLKLSFGRGAKELAPRRWGVHHPKYFEIFSSKLFLSLLSHLQGVLPPF